jgi:ABC-type branched-subunit amino acid transport system permease subunit
MIYAAVVLGGAGSLPGVLLGAAVISVLPEVLRDPDHGRLLFYCVLLVVLLARVRPWWRPLALLAATVALGFGIRLVAEAIWPDAVTAAGAGSDALGRLLGAWVVVPTKPVAIGNAAFVLLVAALLVLTRLKPAVRTLALVPVVWLAAFVWESRLSGEPSVTRQLLVGAILVVMMNARPHGLLGRPVPSAWTARRWSGWSPTPSPASAWRAPSRACGCSST